MDKKTEALKLALEKQMIAMIDALAEQPAQPLPGRNHWEDGDVFERIGAMKKQPEQQQEPVAICCNCLGTKRPQATDPDWKGRCDCEPPQPAQRNPLTDEEIKRMAAPLFMSHYWNLCNEFARAIEAAHGIKGGA